MMLRRLGRSDCLVSAVALGTVKIGRNTAVRYPRPFALPDDAAVDRLLGTARELGINLLDTAPAYGSSEERLGRWLRGRRQDWVLCTKCGEEFDGERSRFDFSPAHTRASVERSLRRLGTDHLDIVLLHSDGDDLAILESSGALETLIELRRDGLVRACGISAKTLPGALAAARCCDVAMLAYNSEDTSMAPALAACAANGCAVLVKKAFGSGHLCATPEGLHQNLATIYAAPGIASVVIGTLDPGHLRENVGVAEGVLGEQMLWMERASAYLNKRYGLALEDVGETEVDFYRRWHDQGNTAEEAIEAFGEKYDLQPIEQR